MFTDSAGEMLGIATQSNRWSIGSTMTSAHGTFRTLDQGLRTDFGWRHWFALQRDSEYSQPQTLMMSGDRDRRFNFRRVHHSDERPFGTINVWFLPDGTPLDAYCVGRQKPFRVLLLKSQERVILSLRYLAPRNQIFTLVSSNFKVGEAILDDQVHDAKEVLPLLMFAFEVLQMINTNEGGGGD